MVKTSTILLAVILIILLFILMSSNLPYAKYVLIQRADGENKYVALKDIEVLNSQGARLEIMGLEGNDIVTFGYPYLNSLQIQNAVQVPYIPFNGKNSAYFVDTILGASSSNLLGPAVAAITTDKSKDGYMLFSLGCSSKISKVSITALDDNTSRINLQNIKITLLDKNRNVIYGTEGVTGVSAPVPRSIHQVIYK
jgi:hypothetical protein